jgi:hypothetical protein
MVKAVYGCCLKDQEIHHVITFEQRLCPYVCTYVHMYAYVCTYVRMYAYVCTYVHMYAYVCTKQNSFHFSLSDRRSQERPISVGRTSGVDVMITVFFVFCQFSAKKIGVFLKNQCYDQNFA